MVAIGGANAAPIELKITTVSVPTDIHTKALHVFKDELDKALPGHFDIQIYDSGTLFGQSGDMDALQRGNAEMAYVSFQLIADNIPEFGLFTAGYLFQSPEHARKVMASDIGKQVKDKVSDGPRPAPSRHLLSRHPPVEPAREEGRQDARPISPASSCACRAPTPGCSSARRSAPTRRRCPSPTSISALQTGTIDAQDNPLPTVEAAKFYEVTKQIMLTSHLVDFINLTVNNQTWDKMTDEERNAMQAAATKACDCNNSERVANEKRLVSFFEEQGPDGHHARRRRLPQARAGLLPELRPRQGSGRRAGSTRSTSSAAEPAPVRSGHERSLATWLRKGADAVGVLFFLATFAGLILQVFFRYVLNSPVAWSEEYTMIAYMWTVFWSAAFMVREREHVSFDIVYDFVSPPTRRVLAIVALAILIVGFLLLLAADLGLPGVPDAARRHRCCAFPRSGFSASIMLFLSRSRRRAAGACAACSAGAGYAYI